MSFPDASPRGEVSAHHTVARHTVRPDVSVSGQGRPVRNRQGKQSWPRYGRITRPAGCVLLLLLSVLANELPADEPVASQAVSERHQASDSATPCGALSFHIMPADGGDAELDEPLRRQQIEERAQQIFEQRKQVARDQRPYTLRRDTMLVEAAQAVERLARSQREAAAVEQAVERLDQQISWTSGSLRKNLQSQQSRRKAYLSTLQRQIRADRQLLDGRTAQVMALDRQIATFDEQLQQLDEESRECRRQWLALHQPLEKYSRCDFEALRRVLDDWLIIDGQWPEAFAWAALCAYELDDVRSAASYLEKAQRLREGLTGSKKLWPQLEALTALVLRKQPGQAGKADAAAARAQRLADRDKSWESYYLLGRYYAERSEEGVRAVSCYQRALILEPAADCALLWLARLQTTSSLAAVRNVSAGTSSLEQLWHQSGRRSWRLASFLAEAYTAGQRTKEAKDLWQAALDQAPRHSLIGRGSRRSD